jgi:hypothetical protein
MKRFDAALVSTVLGIQVDKACLDDEKSPDTILLFKQFGMYKNEMVLENCPEYKYGISILIPSPLWALSRVFLKRGTLCGEVNFTVIFI